MGVRQSAATATSATSAICPRWRGPTLSSSSATGSWSTWTASTARGERGQRERERDGERRAASQPPQHGQADREGQDLQQPVHRARLALEHDAVQEHRQAVLGRGAQPQVDVALAGRQGHADGLRRLCEPCLDEGRLVGRAGHGQRDR